MRLKTKVLTELLRSGDATEEHSALTEWLLAFFALYEV